MLLQFITGTKSVPPLGFLNPISVKFKHGCIEGCKCQLISCKCDLSITLPVHYEALEFQLIMNSALIECAGLGDYRRGQVHQIQINENFIFHSY